MQRANRLNASIVLSVTTVSLLAANAGADGPGAGSFIHPTLPPQPMFPSGPKDAEKLDKAHSSIGKFSLENSSKLGKDGKPLLTLQVRAMPLRAVLEKIGTQTGKQIIITGEIPGSPISLRFDGFTVPQLIESLCQNFDLTLKHITEDLYLIIPPKPTETEFVRPNLPNDIPPLVPRGWRDFEFNGKTYFVVPLLAKDSGDNRTQITKPLESSSLARAIGQLKSKQASEGKSQEMGSIVPIPIVPASR